QHARRVRKLLLQHDAIEEKHEERHRQHVDRRAEHGVGEFGEQGRQIHASAAPNASTRMMGTSMTIAIIPKPSVKGLRPEREDARPMPSAVTSGTVLTDVVTPPES